MTTDTTDPSYWLNWRFFGCTIFVLIPMVIATILICKYEGSNSRGRERRESLVQARGILYTDESWRPCLKDMHPAWLLAYRVVGFFILLGLLVLNVVKDGGSIFYYYTQWTFTLVTIYFGLGSLMSIHGCRYLNKVIGARFDAERGTYVAPTNGENTNANVHGTIKDYWFDEGDADREIAGIWGYVFQIIYQINAGAVILTDCVFWLVIVPFRTMNDYNLTILLIGMHSVNAVILLGDTAINSMRFPLFRISYFLLWTAIYVIFQWIIHACISMWWPYPFLDLSSQWAPLWYFIVAALHIPCYTIFPLFIKLKHFLLTRWFRESYYYVR